MPASGRSVPSFSIGNDRAGLDRRSTAATCGRSPGRSSSSTFSPAAGLTVNDATFVVVSETTFEVYHDELAVRRRDHGPGQRRVLRPGRERLRERPDERGRHPGRDALRQRHRRRDRLLGRARSTSSTVTPAGGDAPPARRRRHRRAVQPLVHGPDRVHARRAPPLPHAPRRRRQWSTSPAPTSSSATRSTLSMSGFNRTLDNVGTLTLAAGSTWRAGAGPSSTPSRPSSRTVRGRDRAVPGVHRHAPQPGRHPAHRRRPRHERPARERRALHVRDRGRRRHRGTGLFTNNGDFERTDTGAEGVVASAFGNEGTVRLVDGQVDFSNAFDNPDLFGVPARSRSPPSTWSRGRSRPACPGVLTVDGR